MASPSDAALREALLPRELWPFVDDRFVHSNDLIEEYVVRSSLEVFRASGLALAFAVEASVDEAIARAGLSPDIAQVPTMWLAQMLARRGWLDRSPQSAHLPRYRLTQPLPRLDAQEIFDLQATHDTHALPAYRIVALATSLYPAVLNAETTGEEALFSRENSALWFDYFSNANSLYAINNAIHAIALMRALSAASGATASPGSCATHDAPRGAVLELGAGLGSATEAILQSIAPGANLFTHYRVTDISPPFLRRAKQALSQRFSTFSLSFGRLDIDEPFSRHGVEPASYALVHGVNVLHVARDLAATLDEIRLALMPHGTLVATECVRPRPQQPLHVEFVFNLLAAFRSPAKLAPWRPHGGFLTSEQWTAALEANGFEDVHVYPESRIRETFPAFVVACMTARRA